MRFTHHAKNKLRQNRWSQGEALSVILNPLKVDADECCNPRYLGYIRGALARVVVAADDPDVVITVHPEEAPMKAYFDSEANAVSIDLISVDFWDDGDEFDEYYCTIAFSKGHLVNIGLLNPSENLHLLEAVAASYDLEASNLIAVAKAALATPDRSVTTGDRVAA